jgi:hypothetical protein
MQLKRKLFGEVLVVVASFLLTAFSVRAVTPVSNSYRVSNLPVTFTATTNVDNNIPKKLYPCLPKQVKKMKLWAHVSANQANYYLVGVYQSSQDFKEQELQPEYQETLVELDDVGCFVIVPKEKMGSVSLIQYVSEEISRELKLQRYRKAIAEIGGKEKFQQGLLENENSSSGYVRYYFPEDAWALKELGIRLPKNAQILEDIEQLKFN